MDFKYLLGIENISFICSIPNRYEILWFCPNMADLYIFFLWKFSGNLKFTENKNWLLGLFKGMHGIFKNMNDAQLNFKNMKLKDLKFLMIMEVLNLLSAQKWNNWNYCATI